MSTPDTGGATEKSGRYEPFGDNGYRTEERPAEPEQEAPKAVTPMVFRTGDDNEVSS